MEDMVSYRKLTDVLSSTDRGDDGLMSLVAAGVEAGMRFVGRVHRETWLADMGEEERGQILSQFR